VTVQEPLNGEKNSSQNNEYYNKIVFSLLLNCQAGISWEIHV